ncbi:transcription factor IIIB 90 kDa subunit [Nematocida homosporus]|uniref:transcription factor IIIB 90 kDa subunit n=1 Tax=Nematocida homosporus TaxID=1912981 RepID=UPI00221E717B|nr:transcription factor IIIB 90 kDa subunit [Nematocida homosporus]KAI5184941.1 transcription factor IIIB 90 kDa subunit [Nematocida homosporus]
MKCAICKTSRIETDAARDISYCTSCGLVIEESTIVSDVQFAQDTKGTSVLQGQYVSSGDSKKLVAGKFITTNHLANIKNTAKSIGDSLGIGETQINAAMRWYNLALQFNFTKGRKTQVLLAACLYITCREEETPHMLIDFAGVLRVNVFKIGSVFLKLIRLLNITVPLVDPSLYVPRFCSKLQLTSPQIAKTSLRLIARMDRDWMVVGRKPAGICGAAILVASRIHGSPRGVEEVAGVVKVCEATINKRLAELKETATAGLSINEFNTVWLEKEEDPPIIKVRGRAHVKSTPEEVAGPLPATPTSIAWGEEMEVGEANAESDLDSEEDGVSEDALLTAEETREKGRIWEAMHEEYLIERKKREVRTKPKTRRVRPKALPLEDAVETAVRAKHLSSRINYTAIKSLFQR